MFGGHGQRNFVSSPDDYAGYSCVVDLSKPEPVFRTLHHLSDFTSSAPYDGEFFRYLRLSHQLAAPNSTNVDGRVGRG